MPIVMCRYCREKFDREKLKENIDWVQPSARHYYHKECYEKMKNGIPKDDNWESLIFHFISHELKKTYDYHMCKTQINNFVQKLGYTTKGIYFTLKYFYEIKNNDWEKGHGGIGIVPYQYKEATDYWIKQESLQKGILKSIEKQINQQLNKGNIIIIKKKKIEKKKPKYTLEDIEED